MLTEKTFIVPNIYSTSTTADAYAYVTGTSSNTYNVDGYKLLGFVVENKTNSTLYVQLFDGYQSAAATGSPILELQVAQNSQASLDLGSVSCIPVKKGILLAASSTQWSFTTVATAMFVTAFWI